jgi:hypothetical protein
MKTITKKIILITVSIIGLVLLVLIILNPSASQFRDFTGNSPIYISRKTNYLIYSVYDDTYNGVEYYGVFANFFPKGECEKKEVHSSTRIIYRYRDED